MCYQRWLQASFFDSNSTHLKRSLEQKWLTWIWGNCKQLTAYAPCFRCKLQVGPCAIRKPSVHFGAQQLLLGCRFQLYHRRGEKGCKPLKQNKMLLSKARSDIYWCLTLHYRNIMNRPFQNCWHLALLHTVAAMGFAPQEEQHNDRSGRYLGRARLKAVA